MFWYKSDGNDPAEVSVISNKNWNTGSNPGFTIGDMRNGMTLNFTGKGQKRQDTGRISAATDNTWHHIAATYDRDGNMILYVDGKNTASVNISKQKGADIDVYDLILGADGMKRQGVTDSWIDELYIYRSVLSQKEIQDYNAPFVLQNLIAEYEGIIENSTAAQEKIDAFRDAVSSVKQEAQGVEDLQKIEELTARLKEAFDDFMRPEKGIMSFEVISDVHVASSNPNHTNAAQFRDMLSDVQQDYPDTAVVLNCGDFTENGSEQQADIYFDILNEYDQFPYMTALGNHDVRWRSGWSEIKERYLRLNGKYMGDNEGNVYYDQWINGYHFIVLNTEWDIKDRAYISPEQLEWLDATMAEGALEGKPIFVVLHQPLNDTFNMSDVYPVGEQDFALKEVLRKYPQTVMFTGHVHNGMGELEIMQTDCGTLVDVPSLRSNNQGDSQGQIGYHVTVYEDKIQLNLRDYRDDEWVLENTYTIPLDPSTYPTGKVLDVTFDGEDASDKSGYENHGILKGSPEFVEGMNGGKAIHIVNSEKAKQYVDFGDIEQINFGTDDFTVMFQYKEGISEQGCIIGNKELGAEKPGFAISKGDEKSGLNLEFSAQEGTLSEIENSDGEDSGEWHAAAVTVDRLGDMILYIDGEEAGRQTINGQENGTEESELNLILGADGLLKNCAQDIYIDNLKIYKDVLGPDEIGSTWNPYKVSAGETDVTISWDISEDDSTEPAYLVINEEKVADIASGETEKTISGLTPGETYTIALVTHEKSRPNNYRDVFPFVVTTEAKVQQPVSTAILEYAIELAKTADTDGVVQSVIDKFNTILANANTILERALEGDSSITQEKVDESWKELVEIMQYLSFKQGDKTDLNKVIELAQTLDLSKYLSEGQDRFTAALENAKGVSANKDAMQEEVDQTWKELLSAMSELRVKPDKSALENLISQAENIDTANYTKESGQVFHKALAQAIKVYQNAEADQQDVDNAVRTLKAAEDSLVAKADGDQQEEKSGISTGNSSNVTKNSETKNSGVRSAKTGDKTQAGALALVMLLSVFAVARTRKERNM